MFESIRRYLIGYHYLRIEAVDGFIVVSREFHIRAAVKQATCVANSKIFHHSFICVRDFPQVRYIYRLQRAL